MAEEMDTVCCYNRNSLQESQSLCVLVVELGQSVSQSVQMSESLSSASFAVSNTLAILSLGSSLPSTVGSDSSDGKGFKIELFFSTLCSLFLH